MTLIYAVLVHALLVIFGIASGIAVGSGFVAFITVLDIIPRLKQLARAPLSKVKSMEWAIVLGVLVSTMVYLWDLRLTQLSFLLPALGLGMGIFVGMLAGALTEVLNVLPILARRIGMEEALLLFIYAMALGKTAGSLFHWLVYTFL
jgi:stage V sporulation protein AB